MKTFFTQLLAAMLLTSTALGQTPPTLFIWGDPVVVEGSQPGHLRVRRAGDLGPVASVNVRFKPGCGPPASRAADPGVDFEASDQRIEFASGEAIRDVLFRAINDGVPEPDEFLTIELVDPSPGVELQNASFVLRITDKDRQPGGARSTRAFLQPPR